MKGDCARVWIVERLGADGEWEPCLIPPAGTRPEAEDSVRLIYLEIRGRTKYRVSCYERVEPKRRKHR